MRVGVKYQPAREALQRAVSGHSAVNHYYNALVLVRQAIMSGLSLDPYGNAIWSPRISSRISKYLVPCAVACMDGIMLCVSIL